MAELGSGNGSGYPSVLDTDTVQESSNTSARSDVPNDLAAAVIAVQNELGTDPAGSLADVKTYLQTEHDVDGTHSSGNTYPTPTLTDGVIAGTSLTADDAAGPAIMNEEVTTTNPTLCPNKVDLDTGWGWATDTLHGIINGTSYIGITITTTNMPTLTLTTALGSGTPIANRLYRENIVKGWAHWTGATPPVKVDDFNVSGVTRTSAGLFVISWDTDFANANYCVVATARNADNAYAFVTAVTAGTTTIQVKDHNGNATDPTAFYVTVIGAQ